ncbi:unnamed protein product [Meloidogyne enterolobii]|uniref:Uncharacterized protein n=1 Tax=Meloidogyne enterolobii TaxID=390850 RepID=A0ACB1A1H0_MELEN
MLLFNLLLFYFCLDILIFSYISIFYAQFILPVFYVLWPNLFSIFLFFYCMLLLKFFMFVFPCFTFL